MNRFVTSISSSSSSSSIIILNIITIISITINHQCMREIVLPSLDSCRVRSSEMIEDIIEGPHKSTQKTCLSILHVLLGHRGPSITPCVQSIVSLPSIEAYKRHGKKLKEAEDAYRRRYMCSAVIRWCNIHRLEPCSGRGTANYYATQI